MQPAPAAPSAPRAARAAASPEPQVGFEAMLARSSSVTPPAKGDVSPGAEPVEPSVIENGDPSGDPSITGLIEVAMQVTLPVVPPPAAESEDDPIAPEPSMDCAVEGPGTVQPMGTDALAVALPELDRRRGARSEQPIEPSADESVEPARPNADAPVAADRVEEADGVASNDPRGSIEADDPRVPLEAATEARPIAPTKRTESRSMARAIVSEVLQPRADVKPAHAVSAVPTASSAVATAPLQPGHGPAIADTPASAKLRAVESAQTETVELDPVARELPLAPQSGSGNASAGERRHEGGVPQGAQRGIGLPDVPASMMFPGQMTFAATVDRALPVAAVPTAPATPEQLATVLPQIVKSMHVQVKAGGGDMTLTLTPEHLGTVTIELRVEHQKVSASLGADTAAVRGWIATHEQDLKAGLADLGLHLDEFVVRDDDPQQKRERHEQRSPGGRRKATKDDERVFEVLV
jgi:hypothetical protein